MKANCLKLYAWAGLALAAGSLRAAPFEMLFRVFSPAGVCHVRKPGSETFEPALKGKAYPYGTAVQTGPGSSATLLLSARDAVRLGADTQVTTAAGGAPEERVLHFARGQLVSSMDAANPEQALTIETPVGRFYALSGNAKFKLEPTPEAFQLDVLAESGGQLKLAGPQFSLPVLKSGFSVRITTTRDQSLTRILNTLGDYAVNIDNGSGDPLPIETNTRSAIRIWRDHAPVGGRLIVSVLATGPDGKGKECFAFAVGQPTVASGTLLEEGEEGATNAPALTLPGAAPGSEPAATPPPPTTGIDALFP